MKKALSYICAAAGIIMPLSANANIDFETPNSGYTSLDVYDCWTESPFRTGKLSGNVLVVDNPDKSIDPALGEPFNPSDKVLGAQRSRYASNLFGVRIDLSEKIGLSPDAQYVHVMVHRPVNGRVALVGLGKRSDRTDQTGEEEQFWVLSNNEIEAGKWCDAVFPIKGSADVMIHSLVVVPECESPHNRTEDFLFYIDNIEVNDDIKPRNSTDFYPINFGKTTQMSRTDRALNSVTLSSPSFGTQKINVNQTDSKQLYNYIPDTYLRAKAGETVSMTTDWTGSWMHAYVYIDRDNDGDFDGTVGSNGYTPDPASDLMSFSFISTTSGNVGYNSGGTYISGNSRDTRVLPSFTIPADLKAGVYRLRHKIDWNSLDPGGSIANGNYITDNGGAITDIILIISDGSKVNVRANQLNGDVTTESGDMLVDYKAEFGKPLKVKMVPAPGFEYAGMKVRHGYLTGDSLYHENPQYRDILYIKDQFDADDCITLPAEIVDGDIFIEGLFVETGAAPERVQLTYNVEYNGKVVATQNVIATVGEAYPTAKWDAPTSSDFYEVTGYPEDKVEGAGTITLSLVHKLPFKVSADYYNAHWYNVMLTAEKMYLKHNPALNYIDLTSSATPAASDYSAQWCFAGDAFTGFMIYNRTAGDNMILSSSHDTSVNTGGATYPVCTNQPVPDTHNTFWIPTQSPHLANGFYLHQSGYPSNKMNSRESRLAYWTGGSGAGSTFTVALVDSTSGIDGITADYDNAIYYNLQGVRVSADRLVPGIYIRVCGDKTTKILVK